MSETTRKPRIYTIGPFRAPTEFQRRQNIARAEALALAIARLGAFYRCPHLHSAHFDGEGDDAYWLALALDMMSECDAAVLVPGPPYLQAERPGASHGSIAEVRWCEANGRPVLQDMDEVRAFVDAWTAGTPEQWTWIRDERRAESIRRMNEQAAAWDAAEKMG